MATIKEIAAEAGVSTMTVSNVINNVKGKVSPATEKRVREIMEKHQYVPNMAARSLISKSSHIIAILLPLWLDSPSSILVNPYASHLVGYFEELLREKEYFMMLCSFSNVEEVLKIQRTWHIDGMIQMFPHDDEITHELAAVCETPLVVIDRYFDDIPMLSVCIEDRKGGYIAARHVLEQGHREIGFAASALKNSHVVRERYRGYLDALSEYGLTPNPEWIFDGIYRREGGRTVAKKILQMDEKPTAMIASEDLIACGIMQTYQETGHTVPDEISLVGFDNSTISIAVTPRLTTINQSVRKKAEVAVEMLMKAIEDDSYRDDQVLLGVDLVERQSVARR